MIFAEDLSFLRKKKFDYSKRMNRVIPLNVVPRGRFDRDLRRMERRGKDLSRLDDIIEELAYRRSLLPRHQDHILVGNWKGHRECHIEPDWLLIYQIDGNDLVLKRTGTHSDLF